MSTIARITTWTAGQVLTASDLNGEFNNIVNDYDGNVTPANFATTLTFTSTQYLDLSAISPSTAKGIRLPAGTGGTNAGNLAWDATAKAGRLGDGTNANYVLNPAAQGTSGYFLTSGGANALPTWSQSAETGTWSADLGPAGTAARAVTTVYQNTTGKKMRVAITYTNANGNNSCKLKVDSVATPALVLGGGGTTAATGAVTQDSMFVEVPNNWYYNIGQSAGTTTIVEWHEMTE